MNVKSGSSLFQILSGMRYFGVGCNVTREIYKFPETYWIITKVQVSKDQLHGKVWGRMVWRGRLNDKEEKIGSPLKNEWLLIPTKIPDYNQFYGTAKDVENLLQKSRTASKPAE
jgi:small subunit ribosomal protein S34